MFADFERVPKITSGLILGDGGYMLTDWLMTPFVNAATDAQMRYNTAHWSTRSTIERCRPNGVLKRRWHCLHAELVCAHVLQKLFDKIYPWHGITDCLNVNG